MDEEDSELDRGLDIAGMGWYNFKFCLILYLAVLSSTFELSGYAMIMPAAKCDLDMSDKQRGVVVALPYVGIILSSFVHGYLVDKRGRKRMLIYTSFLSGFFSALAGLMPNLIGFAICKFITSLCIAGSCSTPYTYIAEIVPERHRDLLLTLTNVGQISGSALVPFLSWMIRPMEFKIDLGVYTFRSWRLLNTVYASVAIVASLLLILVPESPKFLLSKGKADDALKILQNIYAGNTKKLPKEFAVKHLKIPKSALDTDEDKEPLKKQILTLLKWHYLHHILLHGCLLFGIFAILNGLQVWVPDLMTRVFTGNVKGKTACEVIMSRYQKEITSTKCDDSFHKLVFIINTFAQIPCTVVALGLTISIKYIGKKVLLQGLYYVVGIFCVFVNHIRQAAVFTFIVTTFPLMNIAVGVVNAYSVNIFPIHLRATAMGLSMMCGRLGSVMASVMIGALLNEACNEMFYMYGCLLCICGTLVFLYK